MGANYYWDQSLSAGLGGWRNDAGPVRNNSSLITNGWELDSSSVTWLNGGTVGWSNGGTFRIRTEARDNAYPGNNPAPAGNRERMGIYVNLNSRDIVFDPKKPTANATNVPSNGYTNSLAVVNGTASDYDATVIYIPQITAVKVHVFDDSLLKYTYNGTGWESGELLDDAHWLDAVFVGHSSGTWSLAIGNDKWTHGNNYRIVVKAIDKAGNYNSPLSTSTFTYDIYQPMPVEAPSSLISFPEDDQHFNTRASRSEERRVGEECV